MVLSFLDPLDAELVAEADRCADLDDSADAAQRATLPTDLEDQDRRGRRALLTGAALRLLAQTAPTRTTAAGLH
jgi:hypothetical protein